MKDEKKGEKNEINVNMFVIQGVHCCTGHSLVRAHILRVDPVIVCYCTVISHSI